MPHDFIAVALPWSSGEGPPAGEMTTGGGPHVRQKFSVPDSSTPRSTTVFPLASARCPKWPPVPITAWSPEPLGVPESPDPLLDELLEPPLEPPLDEPPLDPLLDPLDPLLEPVPPSPEFDDCWDVEPHAQAAVHKNAAIQRAVRRGAMGTSGWKIPASSEP
jgi:hypothetical protein